LKIPFGKKTSNDGPSASGPVVHFVSGKVFQKSFWVNVTFGLVPGGNVMSSGDKINLFILNLYFMGMVYAEIQLSNAADIVNAKRHIIGEEEVRSMRRTMLVDSGAYMMAINESLREHLGLYIMEKQRPMQLASGEWVIYDVVGPLEVRFEDRTAICNAVILPGDSEPLLGAIPMELMDVLIHPQRQELVVNPNQGGPLFKMNLNRPRRPIN
jgi:hypothetical protein